MRHDTVVGRLPEKSSKCICLKLRNTFVSNCKIYICLKIQNVFFGDITWFFARTKWFEFYMGSPFQIERWSFSKDKCSKELMRVHLEKSICWREICPAHKYFSKIFHLKGRTKHRSIIFLLLINKNIIWRQKKLVKDQPRTVSFWFIVSVHKLTLACAVSYFVSRRRSKGDWMGILFHMSSCQVVRYHDMHHVNLNQVSWYAPCQP